MSVPTITLCCHLPSDSEFPSIYSSYRARTLPLTPALRQIIAVYRTWIQYRADRITNYIKWIAPRNAPWWLVRIGAANVLAVYLLDRLIEQCKHSGDGTGKDLRIPIQGLQKVLMLRDG